MPQRVSLQDYAFDRVTDFHNCGGNVRGVSTVYVAGELVLSGIIEFGDDGQLDVFEVVAVDEEGCCTRRKYSYNGMWRSDFLFRYDRDPVVHADMPEHKHVGDGTRRIPWQSMTFHEVVDEMWDHVRQRETDLADP